VKHHRSAPGMIQVGGDGLWDRRRIDEHVAVRGINKTHWPRGGGTVGNEVIDVQDLKLAAGWGGVCLRVFDKHRRHFVSPEDKLMMGLIPLHQERSAGP
jgi:hypothetical protein